MQIGITLIHAKQCTGKQGGLVTAGSGPDFQNHAALVGGVFGQQQHADRVFSGLAIEPRGGDFIFGHLVQFGICARFIDQGGQIGDFAHSRLPGMYGHHQRLQLGPLARQRNDRVRFHFRGEPLHDGLVTAQNGLEFIAGQ